MDVDPTASMRCWAVEVELGGRTFDVPALPAVDWWPVLVSGDLNTFIDMIVSDDVNDLLLSGTLRADDLNSAMRDAVEVTTGRSFHTACVLAMVADQNWPIVGGAVAKHGFRWDVMPIGAALDLINAVVMESMDEDGRKRFDAVLANERLTGGDPDRGRTRATEEFETFAGAAPTEGGISSDGQSYYGRTRTRTRPRPHPPADR